MSRKQDNVDADESKWIQAAQRGERQAFDHLEAQHRQDICRLCCRFLHNQEDAEDATQDTFAKAWEHLAQFRSEAAFRTWLWDIARNICLNVLRAKRSKLMQKTTSVEAMNAADQKATYEVPDPQPTPETQVLDAAHMAQLRAAIEAKATEKKWNLADWELFALRMETGISYADFAKRHGQDAAYWRNRWRDKIKEAVLDKIGPEILRLE